MSEHLSCSRQLAVLQLKQQSTYIVILQAGLIHILGDILRIITLLDPSMTVLSINRHVNGLQTIAFILSLLW